ncbi:hypothetical protein KI387_004459, partial [Taxus chinensis]
KMLSIATGQVEAHLMSHGFNHLQVKEKYIFPPHQRPQISEVSHYDNILVVDFKDLEGSLRKRLVDRIKNSSDVDGFFQVKEVTGKYAKDIRALVLRLLVVISEALGQDFDYLNKTFDKHKQVMNINYYPPCPNPNLTFGVAPHSDPSGIIVLMQGDVSGLKVLKHGKRVTVEPIPNAFVVNLVDQLEVNHIFPTP